MSEIDLRRTNNNDLLKLHQWLATKRVAKNPRHAEFAGGLNLTAKPSPLDGLVGSVKLLTQQVRGVYKRPSIHLAIPLLK